LVPDVKYKVENISIVPVDLPWVLLKKLRQIQPDIIITHTHIPSSILLLIKKFIKKPIIFGMHGFVFAERKMLGYSTYGYIDILLEEYAIKHADAILVVSRHMAKYLEKLFKINNKKLIYTPNDVDLDEFDSSKIFLNLNKNLRKS